MKEFCEAVALLEEALGHITDKEWDDPTRLHARITKFLNRDPRDPLTKEGSDEQ